MEALDLSELSTSWHSYPKIYSVGHSYLADFFNGPVVAEEKVDGSQFSFGIFNGEIKVRSKGKEIILDAPEKMFNKAIETVKKLAPILKDGWTYRAEFLGSKCHNAMTYDRAPNDFLIIFDINDGHESYLEYDAKKAEATRIGLECVQKLFEGHMNSAADFMKLLDHKPALGGKMIEGVVLKNYTKFGHDKKVLMAKFVCEDFKELNKSTWVKANPGHKDVIQILSANYKTEVRWKKSIQHLKESGRLDQSPKDIGPLIKEVQADLDLECKEDIKQHLYDWAFPQLSRQVIRGLPEFYKEWLVTQQFSVQGDLGSSEAHNPDEVGSNPTPAIPETPVHG